MILDPWNFFFIIMTNLIAAVMIFLFLKVKHKKQNIRNPISHNKNVKDIGLPNAPTSCPFMAAFTHAKQMDDIKKKTALKNQSCISSDNVVDSAKKEAIAERDVKCKKVENCELKTISSHIGESSENIPEQNKGLKNSDEIIKSKYTNNSSEATKNNITSNLKKVTSPDEINSFYEHIPSHVKQLEQEKLMMTLKPEEREAEVKVRYSQLEQIYKLMGEKSELFGISSFDDIHDQMKLYVQ